MATDTSTNFPMMPAGNWWSIREKFKNSIPNTLSSAIIASWLDMTPASATNNILPTLKAIGLVNDEGRVNNELAARWRDDEQYATVCQEMRLKLYPEELLDGFPEKSPDLTKVKRWFANHTKKGESAVQKMVSFFLLLTEGDHANNKNKTKKEVSRHPVSDTTRRQQKANPKPSPVSNSNGADADIVSSHLNDKFEISNQAFSPQLHINIQIHISPESTPEQIEVIFSSMTKHLDSLRK